MPLLFLDWRFATPPPKTPIAIISGTDKATVTGSNRTKARKNFGDKGAWAYPGTVQFFWYPLLSQERVRTLIGSIGTKAH